MIAQADPIVAEAAREALTSAGAPPWAVLLIGALVPLLVELARRHFGLKRQHVAVIQGVQNARVACGTVVGDRIRDEIQAKAVVAGVEKKLNKLVKKVTTSKPKPEAGPGKAAR